MIIFERERAPYSISTDPARLDLDAIHAFLAHESYWAAGIAKNVLARGIAHSLCFGVYRAGAQIGFARVISDYATYAYLNDVYILSPHRGQGLASWLIECVLGAHLRDVLRILEVCLVYDRRARRYTWHLVVENGREPKASPGTNVVAVDLGEIHPAVVGDSQQATSISCRERRHEQQGHAKRLAKLSKALSRKQKGSRRERRLKQARSRMRAKHRRVMRDMEHKISRAVIDVAVGQQANRIVIGDVRDIADGVKLGKQHNQQSSQWNHGQIRRYITYKAEAEGMSVELVEEHYTTQTCPNCSKRHKPRGRKYTCGQCGFSTHRDVVGQINILSRYTTGQVGCLRAPTIIKHRIPHNLRVMRRRRDTGQSVMAVARGTGRQSREAAGLMNFYY